jgi:molybdate transport system regulatory protein
MDSRDHSRIVPIRVHHGPIVDESESSGSQLRISARNIFEGTISAVKTGALNSEIELTSVRGDRIVSVVTNERVRALSLCVGAEACALVKASSVLVMTGGDPAKLSARNCLPGKITSVVLGSVSAEVTIALPGGDAVHATVSQVSATDMGLKAGIAATAVIKASSVLIAVKG